MVKIGNNNRIFVKNGQPEFYLADTCWSAFTNISEGDWDYYLDFRKSQGFNVLQINMLQQWDASQTELSIKPFKMTEDGSFDFSSCSDAYFERAYRMIEKAYEKGLTVALPYRRQFIYAMISGGIAGAIQGINQAVTYAFGGGGLMAFPLFIAPDGNTKSFYSFLLASIVAFFGPIVLNFVFGTGEDKQ